MITRLSLTIIEKEEEGFIIRIDKLNSKESTEVVFDPINKTLWLEEMNDLGRFLKENEYQLRKLLHNKRPNTYRVGFTLQFSIIDKKDIAKFNNKNNIVVTDNGEVYVICYSEKALINIYTDGSFNELLKVGAYGYAIEKEGVIIEERYENSESRSSSHLELLAVIAVLERIQDKAVRIFTDSMYVRKGITEWIYHWRENNFTTVNGTRAKNVDDWIKLDNLIKARYIEWVWIKSHRDNEIHNRVDKFVGQKAKL